MSDLAEVIGVFKETIAADEKIAAWCQGKYGKRHKVFVGVDEANPPAQEDYPLVAIHPGGHRWGMKDRTEAVTVGVICGIVQEAVEASEDAVELAGIVEVEEFRRLVEKALFKTGLIVAGSEAESQSGYFFPIFMSGTEITIESRLTSRGPTGG